MSGTNDYINAYIDVAVGALHENTNSILQLKTENILTKAMVASKDATIQDLQNQLDATKSELESTRNSLQSELENTRNNLQGELNNSRTELEQTRNRDIEELNRTKENATKWEQDYHAVKTKLDNLEGIVNQYKDLKHQYQEKEQQLNDLINKTADYDSIKKELEKMIKKEISTAPKKVINTKNTLMSKIETVPETNDDF
jgi:chromosome segregation ATPase